VGGVAVSHGAIGGSRVRLFLCGDVRGGNNDSLAQSMVEIWSINPSTAFFRAISEHVLVDLPCAWGSSASLPGCGGERGRNSRQFSGAMWRDASRTACEWSILSRLQALTKPTKSSRLCVRSMFPGLLECYLRPLDRALPPRRANQARLAISLHFCRWTAQPGI